MKICIHCERKVHAKGMCNIHYLRNLRTGKIERSIAAQGTGRTLNHQGYIVVNKDGRQTLEHIWLAEKALGKRLPAGAQVHHMNKIRSDNYTYFNLVICPNQRYHKLLHTRAKYQKLRLAK